MASATKQRDRSHARIFQEWFDLPACRRLTPTAFFALTKLLAFYHPVHNRAVTLSVRDLAEFLGTSKTSAADAFRQLEDNGWLAPLSRGRMGKRAPTVYRLTMHEHPDTREPPTRDFEHQD